VSAGQVVMAEALIRWDHPERGQIPPLEFIPLAEETDLMRPLTDWVLAQAVGQCRRLLDAGWRVPIAVNLSVRNLVDDGLAARIGALLEAASVPASSLTVEITESVVMADADGPGLDLALLADRLQGLLRSINRHLRVISIVAGAILFGFGLLMATGQLTVLSSLSFQSPFNL